MGNKLSDGVCGRRKKDKEPAEQETDLNIFSVMDLFLHRYHYGVFCTDQTEEIKQPKRTAVEQKELVMTLLKA